MSKKLLAYPVRKPLVSGDWHGTWLGASAGQRQGDLNGTLALQVYDSSFGCDHNAHRSEFPNEFVEWLLRFQAQFLVNFVEWIERRWHMPGVNMRSEPFREWMGRRGWHRIWDRLGGRRFTARCVEHLEPRKFVLKRLSPFRAPTCREGFE